MQRDIHYLRAWYFCILNTRRTGLLLCQGQFKDSLVGNKKKSIEKFCIGFAHHFYSYHNIELISWVHYTSQALKLVNAQITWCTSRVCYFLWSSGSGLVWIIVINFNLLEYRIAIRVWRCMFADGLIWPDLF